jgi:signal transduction histidine kinase
MIHSLRFRLLLTLIGVVVVVVGTVALFASRITSRELQRFVELDVARNRLLTSNVMAFYGENGSSNDPRMFVRQVAGEVGERIIVTDGAGQVQADSTGQLIGEQLSCDVSFPAVIVTLGGTSCSAPAKASVAGYGPLAAGSMETSDIVFIGMPFTNAVPVTSAMLTTTLPFDTAVAPPEVAQARGPALLIRRTQGLELDPIEAGFVDAVNRSLVWAVAFASVAAVLLTLLLSRRILGPIEALTEAARAMEKGNLSRRVAATSRDEIGALARAFNAMADGLARQEKLRRNMVTDVAHELRTPLTNIRGYLEALRDGVARPTPALLASLHEEALLLNHLVDDLQDLALAEAGQLRLAPRTVNLAAVVAQAADAVRPAAAEKELRVDVALGDDLPPLHADPERVGQVLRNLLNNAITHTPPSGSICVEAEYLADCGLQIADYVTAQSTTRNQQSAILVRVHDTGPGIPEEHLPNVFERFYRVDRARARATGGAGLGLAIVRQIVEAHGGRVWATNRPGAGAAFSFTLPIAASQAADLIVC